MTKERTIVRIRIWCTLFCVLMFVGGLSQLGTQALASTFTACVSQGTVSCALGPSPASGSFSSNTSGSGSSSASAFSTGGILGGSAAATSTGTSSSFNTNSATFSASAIIDDLIISGPGAEASIQVTADLDGFMNFSGLNGNDATGIVTARLQIGNSTTLTGFNLSIGATNSPVIDTTLTSGAITLPTNTNLEVKMTLEGSVVASDNFGPGSASAVVSFLDGMSFPTTGPVFILPVGYTANSVIGNIVDNLFVVPNQPGDFDGNGIVDGYDFLLWQRNPSVGSLADWEANYGLGAMLSASSVAVPEPTTCTLTLALRFYHNSV
jgi:hypothetical protein